MDEACVLPTVEVETFHSPASESDSDDEPVALLCRKSKVGRLRLQPDSDEDDDNAVSSEVSSVPRADSPSSNGMEIDEESNDAEEKSLPKAKTGKRRIVKHDSSSDEDESTDKPLKSYGFRNKLEKDSGEMDSRPNEVSVENKNREAKLDIASNDSPEENSGSLLRNKILANSDLFDAEGSSGDDAGNEDDVSLEDIKKAARRLAKTSSKPPQPTKMPKPKKGDRQLLHSESQRMVRQSRVRLPYHVPQQRTLDDFLNRKKIVPNAIKPNAKETESILKKLVKVQQKPVTNCQVINKLPVIADSCSNHAENLEPSSKPTHGEASGSKEISETSINLAKRRLDLELPVIEHKSPDSSDIKLDEVRKVDAGIATEHLQQIFHQSSDEEEDLPDLIVTTLNPSKSSARPSCAVLNHNSPVAVTAKIPESNPHIDSLVQISSVSKKKTKVEMEAEPATPVSDQNVNNSKISMKEVSVFKPRLSGAPHTIIDLDEDEEDENAPLGSSTPAGKRLAGPQKVVLSILKKETDSSGQERLVNENLTITLSDETKPNSQTQGSTLLCLKEKLKAEIAKRRAETRQKRLLMRAEDDEEGFEGDHDSENESEEEEILSDPTDSEEGDEDDECEIIGNELKKTKKPKNAFIEEEAEDEDDQGSDKDDESEKDEEENEPRQPKKGVRLRLQLESDSSDDETPMPLNVSSLGEKLSLSRCDTSELFPPCTPNIQIEEDEHRTPLARDTSMDTSFELMGSLVPAHQPGGGIKRNKMQSNTPLRRNYSTLSLPIENSQDLFSQNVPAEDPHYPLSPRDHYAVQMSMEESSEFAIKPKVKLFNEDDVSTQENANELYNLCSGTWADTDKSKPSTLWDLCGRESPKNTQETMDELTDLCSGKFTSEDNIDRQRSFDIAALCDPPSQKDTQGKMDQLVGLCSGEFADADKSKTSGLSALCDPVSPKNTQETMDELTDLCSGKFTNKDNNDYQRPFNMAALCDPPSQKDTQGKMDQLFGLCSGKFTSPTKDGSFADDNRETQGVNRTSALFDRSDDELSISSLKSTSPKARRKRVKRIFSDAESDEEDFSDHSNEEVDDAVSVRKESKKMKEFFEDEAELSGSDAPSDEDDEIAEEDDILEEELGDLDDLAEEELKNQVEKVHMKMMMDDDQRQLRLYKEMYLEDGDLHTDGQGRVRKFRWRNVDDDSNDDGVLKRDSDSEGEDGENDAENAAFRMQRHEREKWLGEYKKSNAADHSALIDDAEASQFKAVKKVSILRRSSSLVVKSPNSPSLTPTLSRQSSNFCGSFLARGKDALAKMAELTKGSGKEGLNGPRNSRNFVFSVVSPVKQAQTETPKLRRASSTPSSILPAAKKCRLEVLPSVPSNDSSIFDLL